MQLLELVPLESLKRKSSLIAKLVLLSTWLFDALFKIAFNWQPEKEDWSDPFYIESRVFFLLLAIAIAIWSAQKIDNFFEFVFMEWAIWNIGDEILGMGSVFQWYEPVLAVGALIFAWFKFRK